MESRTEAPHEHVYRQFAGRVFYLDLWCFGSTQELLQLCVHWVLMLQSQLLLKLRHSCIRTRSIQVYGNKNTHRKAQYYWLLLILMNVNIYFKILLFCRGFWFWWISLEYCLNNSGRLSKLWNNSNWIIRSLMLHLFD